MKKVYRGGGLSKRVIYVNIFPVMMTAVETALTSKVLFYIAFGLGSLLALSFFVMITLTLLERHAKAHQD